MTKARKRGHLVVDPAALPLLTLLGRLRCASYGHLKALLCGASSDHALAKLIEVLFADGLLAIVALPRGRHGYVLTPRAIRGVPTLRSQFKDARATVSDRTAVQGWQRAALWAHFTRRGALVLTGKTAVGALRENRLAAVQQVGDDIAQTTKDELRCRIDACLPPGGDIEGLDVARTEDGVCTLLVADNPYARMLAQIEALPIAISAYDRELSAAVYLSRLPVVFVPSDQESRWDDAKGTWAAQGPRLRQWLRYTGDDRPHEGFPFCKALANVDPPPQAILHRDVVQSRSFSRVTAGPNSHAPEPAQGR